MHKQSLFHISKRDALPWYQALLIRGGAIILALIVCALVTMLLTGENPISIYGTIFYGAFGTARKSWVTFQNLAVLLGISLWQYFTTFATDRLVMAGVLVLVIAFLIYSRLTAPKKALKRWESGMRRSYGTDALHLTTEFFDHSLAQSVEECDDLIVEGYSKISELRETEHLLLLRCSARQWFFVDKSGFTVGDAEQCKDFLRDRIGR